MRQITKTGLALLLVSLFLFSCSEKTKEISEDKFIGIWEIKGTSIMDGTQIQIQRENNRLIGRIHKLNDNKYVKLFSDSNEVWIPEISRVSNYEFKLIENKIGKELFALYEQKTNQEFKVQFIDDNTIGLTINGSDPSKSIRIYKRLIIAR
jgi:hypothetical protein